MPVWGADPAKCCCDILAVESLKYLQGLLLIIYWTFPLDDILRLPGVSYLVTPRMHEAADQITTALIGDLQLVLALAAHARWHTTYAVLSEATQPRSADLREQAGAGGLHCDTVRPGSLRERWKPTGPGS